MVKLFLPFTACAFVDLQANANLNSEDAADAQVKVVVMEPSSTKAVCYGASGDSVQLTILTGLTDRLITCNGDCNRSSASVPSEYKAELLNNRLELAKFGGYEYCQYNGVLDHRFPAWSKILAILALFQEGRQQVVWMDGDAVMVHPRRFEDIMSKMMKDKDVLFTSDYDEDGQSAFPTSSINSGVFIVRNTPWVKQFLMSVNRDFPNPEGFFDVGRYDQRAISLYRKRNLSDFNAHVSIVGWRLMNTHLAQDDGNAFIIHAAGMGELKYQDLLEWYLNPSQWPPSHSLCGRWCRKRDFSRSMCGFIFAFAVVLLLLLMVFMGRYICRHLSWFGFAKIRIHEKYKV